MVFGKGEQAHGVRRQMDYEAQTSHAAWACEMLDVS